MSYGRKFYYPSHHLSLLCLLIYPWYDNTLFHERKGTSERKWTTIMLCSERGLCTGKSVTKLYTNIYIIARRETITHVYSAYRVKRCWKDKIFLIIILTVMWSYRIIFLHYWGTLIQDSRGPGLFTTSLARPYTSQIRKKKESRFFF